MKIIALGSCAFVKQLEDVFQGESVEVVGAVCFGDGCLEEVEIAGDCDIAVLECDTNYPMEYYQGIRKNLKGTALVTVVRRDDVDWCQMADIGAQGYIYRESSKREINARVKAILRSVQTLRC